MVSLNPNFVNGNVYHIANFGIENRLVFTDEKDITRFLDLLDYYRIKNPPQRFAFRKRPLPNGAKVDETSQVELLAYVIMPDHFHLLIKQITDKGVQNYVSKVINSYTKYFNSKQKRRGTLFVGPFQAREISTADVSNLSRYIHLDPMFKNIISDAFEFPYSSLPQYMGEEGIVGTEVILANYKSAEDYKAFIKNEEDYKAKLPSIKNLLLD